jgi:endonuclease YncB( thermonuclease family)
MIEQHGGPLRIVSHGLDKYGRWVVELFATSGVSLNELMVQQGHAKPYM